MRFISFELLNTTVKRAQDTYGCDGLYDETWSRCRQGLKLKGNPNIDSTSAVFSAIFEHLWVILNQSSPSFYLFVCLSFVTPFSYWQKFTQYKINHFKVNNSISFAHLRCCKAQPLSVFKQVYHPKRNLLQNKHVFPFFLLANSWKPPICFLVSLGFGLLY